MTTYVINNAGSRQPCFAQVFDKLTGASATEQVLYLPLLNKKELKVKRYLAFIVVAVLAFFCFLITISSFVKSPAVVTPIKMSVVTAKALKPLPADPKFEAISNGVSKKYGTISSKEANEVVRLVFKQASIQKLDPYLVVAVIAAESSFKRKAVSEAGAKGFMQIMDDVHKAKVKGRNPFDTKVNVEVGMKILSDCFKKHKTNRKALGCYNGATTAKAIDNYYIKVVQKQNSIKKLVAVSGGKDDAV